MTPKHFSLALVLASTMLHGCTNEAAYTKHVDSATSGPSDSGRTDTSNTLPDTGDIGHTSDDTESVTAETGDTGSEFVECDHSIPWSYVEAGYHQTCGVHTDGCAECWGAGAEDDGYSFHYSGADRPPAGTYRSVHLTRYFKSDDNLGGCGILVDGSVKCWGDNEWGEGTIPAGDYADVAVAPDHTFTVSTGRTLDWFGVGSSGDPPDGQFVKVVAEDHYSLALRSDGSLTEFYYVVEEVYSRPGPYIAMSLSPYAGYSCAVTVAGAVECWQEGTVDNPSFEEFNAKAPTESASNVCTSPHTQAACALLTDGSIKCWSDLVGVPIVDYAPTTNDWTQISCGGPHACAVSRTGQLTCWGESPYGEIDPPT